MAALVLPAASERRTLRVPEAGSVWEVRDQVLVPTEAWAVVQELPLSRET